MNTKYSVVKTSTGRFRIQADYGKGMILWVGGKHSLNFCFFTAKPAQDLCDQWSAEEAKMEAQQQVAGV